MSGLPLTPDVLASAYDYLVSTEPFCRWNLPDSEDIKFRVTRAKDCYAAYHYDGGHTIDVSSSAVGQTDTLMQVMGHEMTHLHLRITGMESRSDNPNVHNGAFRKLAARICQTHGWDLKAFY